MIRLMLKKLLALTLCVSIGTISTITCFAADADGEKLISGTTGTGGIQVQILVTEKVDENADINISNIGTIIRQISQVVSDADGKYSTKLLGLETGKWYVAKINDNDTIKRIEFYCATNDERLVLYQQIAAIDKSSAGAFDSVKQIITNNQDILNWDLTIFNMLENETKVASQIIDMSKGNTDGSSLEAEFQELMNSLYSEQTVLNERKAVALSKINTKKWDKIKEVLNSYADILEIYGFDRTSYTSLHPETQTTLCQTLAKATYTDITEFVNAVKAKIAELKTTVSTGSNSGSGGSGGGGSVLGGFTAQVYKPAFNDLDSVEWAKASITSLYDKGIVSGVGAGRFAPNEVVTREQFLKMLILSANLFDKNASAEFSDVSKSDWSYGYIASAYKIGVASGIGGGLFGKEALLTRQDAATFAYRVIKFLGIRYELPDGKTKFTDNSDIAEYALDAVAVLSNLGVINGMGDGSFKPQETITRAQTAVMVNNLMKAIAEKQ